jgi:quinone-modifying oxidoreductase subunit QmoB
MANQLGVYVCSGCGICDAVDTAKLAAFAHRELKPTACQVHPFLCGTEGTELIKCDLASGAVGAVVIAGCTPRTKTGAFDFGSKVVCERVNLREQVAWCQRPRDEDTQAMAEDYLRMGCSKAQKAELTEPLAEEISKKVLVVGGGITGLTAALAGADAGYEVVLVEKEPRLGGFMSAVKKSVPHRPPFTEPVASDLAHTVLAVSKHPKIQAFTSARVGRLEGQPGMFDVTIETDGKEAATRVGAVILATGWKPYDASRLTNLGYGMSPDVITGVEFERMAAAGPIVRPSNGRSPASVLFVQCAGSCDKDHLR